MQGTIKVALSSLIKVKERVCYIIQKLWSLQGAKSQGVKPFTEAACCLAKQRGLLLQGRGFFVLSGRLKSFYHLRKVFRCFDSLCLLQLLIVELARCQVHLFASEVFDAEAYAAQLDRIELLDLVIKLALWVLEGANYEPESINGLFLSARVTVLDIESLWLCR